MLYEAFGGIVSMSLVDLVSGASQFKHLSVEAFARTLEGFGVENDKILG